MSKARPNGTTCICYYDGKPWPVVLCNDKYPPPAFMETRQSPWFRPAILLGKHKYIWVADSWNKDIDPTADYSGGLWERVGDGWRAKDQTDATEQARCNAFMLNVVEWRDDESWSHYLLSEAEARRLQREKKRRRANAEDDSYGTSDFSDRSFTYSPSQRKRRGGWSDMLTGAEEIPNNTGWRSETIDLADHTREIDGLTNEEKRQQYEKRVILKSPSYTQYTIFAGEEGMPFTLLKMHILKCEFLGNRVQFDNDLRSYVKLYEHSNITSSEFEPAHDFLITKEFEPKLIRHEDGDQVKGALLPEERLIALGKVVAAYMTATKLRLAKMQKLCIRKIKALCPLSVAGVTLLVKYSTKAAELGASKNEDLRSWLVDYTARHGSRLDEENRITMGRLMKENPAFQEEVDKLIASFTIGKSA